MSSTPSAEILSPELCLVDPALARRARRALVVQPPRGRWTNWPWFLRRSLVVSAGFLAWLLLVHPQTASISTTLDPPAQVRTAKLAGPARATPHTRPPAAVTTRTVVSPAARGTSASLTWPRVPAAAFYDLILSRGGRRVLDLWPTTARVVLPEHWTFHGERFSLAEGSYQWFVYPASGTREAARYGALAARGNIKAPGAS